MKTLIDQLKTALKEREAKGARQNTWARLSEDESALICATGHRKRHPFTIPLRSAYMKRKAIAFVKSATKKTEAKETETEK